MKIGSEPVEVERAFAEARREDPHLHEGSFETGWHRGAEWQKRQEEGIRRPDDYRRGYQDARARVHDLAAAELLSYDELMEAKEFEEAKVVLDRHHLYRMLWAQL